jgi:threonine dehydrogenase-like Zn-dependent dehydrogenase
MKAAVMYGAGDVRVEDVPDPRIELPTDALVRVVYAAVCGSDLWPYRELPSLERGIRVGHEFLGVIEGVGSEVTAFRPGDVVVAPFRWSDGTCEYCREGLNTSCLNGGSWGGELDGGQGEAVRVPQAEGTLLRLPIGVDDPRLLAALTLADVMCAGHHAARNARVRTGATVAVVGDGAVGLCGVLAASRLGAERIIVLGGHDSRIKLARSFGATEVVPERGDEAVARVRELTGGQGAHAVLECVGTGLALSTAVEIARHGGAVGYVGVPQADASIDLRGVFRRNITIAGGVAPARAYMPELLPDVLSGRLDPAPIFDRMSTLDSVPADYEAMKERRALKVLIRFPV